MLQTHPKERVIIQKKLNPSRSSYALRSYALTDASYALLDASRRELLRNMVILQVTH